MFTKKITLVLSVFVALFIFNGTLFAQEKAFPKKGEGITLFLKRHNRVGKEYHDEFVKLNKTKLGNGNSLKMGVKYQLPPLRGAAATVARKPNYEPLFGKEMAEYKVTSSELKGCCFYLVSGHGGPDPGAIGKMGNVELHEDEYAYDIALRLARNLMQEGAEVHIIIQDAKDGIRDDSYLSNSKRETCMGDVIPLNQVQRLQQRCNKINALYQKDRKNYSYCRAIFIHVDSRSKGKQTDVFFYHSNKKAVSKRLANNMKDTFESKYGKHQPNRGFSGTVSGRNLYVLSHTTPASVFVELGNIQNSFDQRRLVINSNRQALAKWLMEGFLKDYKEKK